MYIKPVIVVMKIEDLLCAIGTCRNNQSVDGCSSDHIENTYKKCKS